MFFKTTFPQFYAGSIAYQVEHAGAVIAEGSVDFSKHYTFQRGEPRHFTASLIGRASGKITGELIFDGVPTYFQVRPPASLLDGGWGDGGVGGWVVSWNTLADDVVAV